jgi:hypothetical protein
VSTPHPGREQAESDSEFPFVQLDFLYMPSRDVAADGAYFTDVLGGRIVFAIEAMGTRVAIYQLTRPEVGNHFDGRRDSSHRRMLMASGIDHVRVRSRRGRHTR